MGLILSNFRSHLLTNRTKYIWQWKTFQGGNEYWFFTSRVFSKLRLVVASEEFCAAGLMFESDWVCCSVVETREPGPVTCSTLTLGLRLTPPRFTLSLRKDLTETDFLLCVARDQTFFDLSSMMVGNGRLLKAIPESWLDKFSSVRSRGMCNKEPANRDTVVSNNKVI